LQVLKVWVSEVATYCTKGMYCHPIFCSRPVLYKYLVRYAIILILPVQSLYPPLQNQMAILPGEPGNNVNNNVYTMSSCFHLLLMPINMHIIFLKI